MNNQLNQSIGIMLATAVFLNACADKTTEGNLEKGTPISVHVGTPIQQSGEKITVSGQIESRQTAAISTRMMGFISSIKVKLGDAVEKGQLLVTISDGDILAKRAQAQAMIAETEAALTDARKDYERFEQLYQQHSASAKEFENATLRYNSVKAKTEAAQQMKIEADEALTYANLLAPFSGVVTQKNSDEGSMANPGVPILMIERSNEYDVRASVSEGEVGKLKKGMHAEVTVKSNGEKFAGKISEISPSSQFSGGQFVLKVMVSAGEIGRLFSGMHVNVDIPLRNSAEVQSPMVPVSAIIHREQLSGLYTVGEDQTAQLRWVKTGKQNGELVEILSGLKAEEKFITQSEGRLYSGAPVMVSSQIELTVVK